MPGQKSHLAASLGVLHDHLQILAAGVGGDLDRNAVVLAERGVGQAGRRPAGVNDEDRADRRRVGQVIQDRNAASGAGLRVEVRHGPGGRHPGVKRVGLDARRLDEDQVRVLDYRDDAVGDRHHRAIRLLLENLTVLKVDSDLAHLDLVSEGLTPSNFGPLGSDRPGDGGWRFLVQLGP